jgi:Sec-independent protein secretion pathway component TatC
MKLGILEHRKLVASRKYFFVISLVVCSFITPDFLSTFVMMLQLMLLFELCLLISARWPRQKRS